jgi:hypothetical protein
MEARSVKNYKKTLSPKSTVDKGPQRKQEVTQQSVKEIVLRG